MSHVGPRGCQIAPSVSERARQTKPSAHLACCARVCETGWGRRFRLPGLFFTPSDALGYLDRQWIGFHHTLVGRRPIATGWKPAPQESLAPKWKADDALQV